VVGKNITVLVFLFLILVNCDIQAANENIVVAGNIQRIDKPLLNAVFGRRLQHWDDGTPITVVVFPRQHPLHIKFCKEVLGVFPYQLHIAWDRMIYSGLGEAPVEVEDISEMKIILSSVPGAIGYLPETEVEGNPTHIKKINIVRGN